MAQDLGFRVSGLGLRALGLRLGLRVRALGLFPILGISAQGKCKLSRTGPKGGSLGSGSCHLAWAWSYIVRDSVATKLLNVFSYDTPIIAPAQPQLPFHSPFSFPFDSPFLGEHPQTIPVVEKLRYWPSQSTRQDASLFKLQLQPPKTHGSFLIILHNL